MTRSVQTVANSKVIRRRHHGDQPLHPTRKIEARTKRIAPKHAHGLKVARGGRRFDWIAENVDCCIVLQDVRVLRSWEVSEDALTRGRGQHVSGEHAPGQKTLSI